MLNNNPINKDNPLTNKNILTNNPINKTNRIFIFINNNFNFIVHSGIFTNNNCQIFDIIVENYIKIFDINFNIGAYCVNCNDKYCVNCNDNEVIPIYTRARTCGTI